MKKEEREIVNINMDFGCRDNCFDCEKYFDCNYEKKRIFERSGRYEAIREKMSGIKYKIAVLSGKGGVGKSTISANLAFGIAERGFKTAVVDSDFYGPSIPKILGVQKKRLKIGRKGIIPVEGPLGIGVVSTDYLMEENEALTWFHDLKRGAIEEFLAHVDYRALDFLVIDLPPGTGSETINLLRCIPEIDGVVVVTIPSQVSKNVARRAVSICEKMKVPIIGVIENMSGFVCPDCGKENSILSLGGGEELSSEVKVPFLGRIPLEKSISEKSDKGTPFFIDKDGFKNSKASIAFKAVIDDVIRYVRKPVDEGRPSSDPVVKSDKLPHKEEFQTELLKINYEIGWNCNFICEDCYRYLDCPQPQKREFGKRGRNKKIEDKTAGIKVKIAVMSGKGGVGKSTVAANLCYTFALQGFKTAILDIDFSGPSIPKMLGVQKRRLTIGDKGINPIVNPQGIKIISTNFLLDEDEHLTWFHNTKREVFEKFLADVDYSDIECLVFDLPPGTGPETVNLLKYFPYLDGVVIVTIPSEVSQNVAKRGIVVCQKTETKVLGVIENMSGFICPGCNNVHHIFPSGGGQKLAKEMNVPFLGEIPFDEKISLASDAGESIFQRFSESPVAQNYKNIMDRIFDNVS
ncbi:MAG: Mrp/NBP35 family ATP-binding protein [Thermodesulfobacteriota bacterium]|nr:Mrp/NBP35 family ATP-binding protein [Thermodesulfobacteriota bacterium]